MVVMCLWGINVFDCFLRMEWLGFLNEIKKKSWRNWWKMLFLKCGLYMGYEVCF